MNLLNLLDGYMPYESIIKNLGKTPMSIAGVADSAQSHLISAISKRIGKNTLVITYSDMEARAVTSGLRLYIDIVVMFPSKDYVFYNIETMGRANSNARRVVLDKITEGGVTVVASVDAGMTFTAEKSRFLSNILKFKSGDELNLDEVSSRLVAMGYKREEIIEGAGQFSVRGGILDVFSPNYENPVRIELWGDEIDAIRFFDADSQRAIENVCSVRIIPVTEVLYSEKRREEIVIELERRLKSAKHKNDEYANTLRQDIEGFKECSIFPSIDKYISLIYGEIPSLTDYFDKDTLAFVIDPKRVSERMRTFHWEKGEELVSLKEKGIIGSEKTSFYRSEAEVTEALSSLKLISLEMLSHTKNNFTYKHLESIISKTTVSFHGKLEYLYEDLMRWQEDGYTVVVLANTSGRAENLNGVFYERGISARISDGEFE